jgi:hypothetical protein
LTIVPRSADWRLDDDEEPCTELAARVPLIWPDDLTTSHATLTDLSNGSRIAIGDPNSYAGEDYENRDEIQTKHGTLLGGQYELHVPAHSPGRWECSEYDPDGCSWITAETVDRAWRFKYMADTTSHVAVYKAPWTRLAHGTIHRLHGHAGQARLVDGEVVGTVEKSDYTLSTKHGLPGRKVTLYAKTGKWIVVGHAKAGKGGKLHPEALLPRGASYKSHHQWRLSIAAHGEASPGTTYKFRF